MKLLNLWACKLKSLPESIGNLTSLEKLNLEWNRLEKLPESTLRHIKVLEESMENHYSIWASVYPQLALAVDPIVKAKIEQQLKGVIKDMKRDLEGILNFIEQSGLYLDDHYIHIRNLVIGA